MMVYDTYTARPRPHLPTTRHLDSSTTGTAKPAAWIAGVSAKGMTADASENQRIPPASTALPPYLSAKVPPSNWVAMYPQIKAAWITPWGWHRH